MKDITKLNQLRIKQDIAFKLYMKYKKQANELEKKELLEITKTKEQLK